MAIRDANDRFLDRHIGPSPDERARMLAAIGLPSLDALIDEAVRAGAKGYNTVTIHNTAESDKVHGDIKSMLYDKGQGTAKDAKELGQLAHTRGMVISMLQVEAIRTAQEKFGKGKK